MSVRVCERMRPDLFRNNSRYLDKLRAQGPKVFNKDGYNDVERLTTVVREWKGPSAGPVYACLCPDISYLLRVHLIRRTHQRVLMRASCRALKQTCRTI